MDPKFDSTNATASEAAAAASEKVAAAKKAASEADGAMKALPEAAQEIIVKIGESQNVLVALSSDPSVDEMAAAIGLSLFLDKIGKRATAIYSGATPNALEFLKPQETFESSTDALQDFVIALNKEKADHLRYKLDGDFVKIFITPYKARLGQEDLTFSYGDFNVDLVLALDVANGVDLDAALREYGRIMHDAVIANITTGNPGKLGEIEWSDKKASSVSEMVARLLYHVDKDKLSEEETTALLTGIVAATSRFSNARTTPDTMEVSSMLMRSGANQQLVTKNITPDLDNEFFEEGSKILGKPAEETKAETAKSESNAGDAASPDLATAVAEVEAATNGVEIAVGHDEKATGEVKLDTPPTPGPVENSAEPSPGAPAPLGGAPASTDNTAGNNETKSDPADGGMLADLKAVEESLGSMQGDLTAMNGGDTAGSDQAVNGNASTPVGLGGESNGVAQAGAEASSGGLDPAAGWKPEETSSEPSTADKDAMHTGPQKGVQPLSPSGTPDNPAMAMAPGVPSAPEINGVPEMNFTAPADTGVLPPPPTPPVDMTAPLPTPPAGGAMPEMALPPIPGAPGATPSADATAPQSASESFQIPGM